MARNVFSDLSCRSTSFIFRLLHSDFTISFDLGAFLAISLSVEMILPYMVTDLIHFIGCLVSKGYGQNSLVIPSKT